MKPPNAPNAGIIIRLPDAKNQRLSSRRSSSGYRTVNSITVNAASSATPAAPNHTTLPLDQPSSPARDSAYSVIAAPPLPVNSPNTSILFCASFMSAREKPFGGGSVE